MLPSSMSLRLSLGVALCLLVPACSATKSEVKFSPYYEKIFSPRKSIPKISSQPPHALETQGYVKIGTLKVTHTLQECYPFEECETSPQTLDATSHLVQDATGRGGDLIILDRDNEAVQEKISKNNRDECAEMRTIANVGPNLGPGGGTQVLYVPTCVRWVQIKGTKDLQISQGTLWRQDIKPSDELRTKESLVEAAAEQAQIQKEQTRLEKLKSHAWVTYIESGDTKKVQELIANGWDVNSKTENGITGLFLACENNHNEVALLLLQHGADVNRLSTDFIGGTALHTAAVQKKEGHVQLVQLLVKHGADGNIKDRINQETALHRAAMAGASAEIIKLLIQSGAEINAMGEYGSPLMKAAENGRMETAKALIAHGADVNAKDKAGNTALALAKKDHHPEIVRLLQEHGAKR